MPAHLHGAPLIAIVVLWTGPPAQSGAVLKGLHALSPPMDAVGPMPYSALQGMFERPAAVQVPTRAHGAGGFLADLPAAAVAAATRVVGGRPSPLGSILFQPMGGAFARMPEGATPLGCRDAAWHWQAGTAWFELADDERSRGWVADAGHAIPLR